jgi:SNF2 family DNA or RNA helicase
LTCAAGGLTLFLTITDQAFSRVHRIGQAKEVYIDRLTINNTVEQRIGEMQERKKALADASLGEGNGDKLGKLSVGDIGESLFLTLFFYFCTILH